MTENLKIDIAIGRDFPKKVIPLIDSAKKSIYIMVYDWIWYPDQQGSSIQIFNNAVIRAHRRGVDVRCVVWNHKMSSILNRLNIKNKWVNQSHLLHVKMMLIDDNISIVGSHNYTKNAFDLNFELSMIINDLEIYKKLERFFFTFSA